LVNRSVHALDHRSAARILGHSNFADEYAPKVERQLLRIAVDWATQPHRNSAEIAEVMGQIYFAALPAFTLFHLDRNEHIRNALRTFCDQRRTYVRERIAVSLAKLQHSSRQEMSLVVEEYSHADHVWKALLPTDPQFVWTRFDEEDIQHLTTKKLFRLTMMSARLSSRLQEELKNSQKEAKYLTDKVERMEVGTL